MTTHQHGLSVGIGVADYVVDTGSANAYAIAYSPAVESLVAGQRFVFKAANANTGASTLAVNGLTATAITKDGAVALVTGDILANMVCVVEYDGTQFQLINPADRAFTASVSVTTPIVYGSTASAGTLELYSTSNISLGNIFLNCNSTTAPAAWIDSNCNLIINSNAAVGAAEFKCNGTFVGLIYGDSTTDLMVAGFTGKTVTIGVGNTPVAVAVFASTSITMSQPVTSSLGTITTSQPALSATQTWATSGVSFYGLLINITYSTAATGSRVADFQMGGVSLLSIASSTGSPGVGLVNVGANGTNTAYLDVATAGSGTAALFATFTVGVVSLSAFNSSVTTTVAASLYVAGPPTASTHETITAAYAMYIASGNVYFSTSTTITVGAVATIGNSGGGLGITTTASGMSVASNAAQGAPALTTGSCAWWYPNGAYTDNTTLASGTCTGFATYLMQGVTLNATNTGVITTDAATLVVTPPTAGTHETFTNTWAIYTSGNVRMNNLVLATASSSITMSSLATLSNVGGTLAIQSLLGVMNIQTSSWTGTSSANIGGAIAINNISTFTFTDSATANSGTLATWCAISISAPNLAATHTSVSTTNASTLYLGGPPVATGGNETITHAWTIFVNTGNCLFPAVYGSIASSGSLSLVSTTNATLGNVYLNCTSTTASAIYVQGSTQNMILNGASASNGQLVFQQSGTNVGTIYCDSSADLAINAGSGNTVTIAVNATAIAIIGSTVATFYKGLVSTLGTITTSQPVISATQTWNASGVAFYAATINVTTTAYATGSRFLSLQNGGVEVFSVDPYGNMANAGTSTNVSTRMAAKRTVTGVVSYVGNGGVYVDLVNNEIGVCNDNTLSSQPYSVSVFSRTASGAGTILRQIYGASSTFSSTNVPTGIAVDTTNNLIFVTTTGSAGNQVLVFSRTANGNVAPTATLSGAATTLNAPQAIYVDLTNNEIGIANYSGSSVLVFSRTASGNTAPLRTISGAATGLSSLPRSIYVDLVNNEIGVGVDSQTVRIFSRSATGNVAPLRTFTTNQYQISMAVDTTNNEIVCFQQGTLNQIAFYSRTATGTPTPLRIITGSSLTVGSSTVSAGYLDLTNGEVGAVDSYSTFYVFPRTWTSEAISGNQTLSGYLTVGDVSTLNGLAVVPTSVSAAYTFGFTDSAILFTTGATSGMVGQLPPATGSGRMYYVVKVDSGAGTVTVTAAGSDKINGSGTYSLSAQYKYIRIIDGSSGNWYNIGSN